MLLFEIMRKRNQKSEASRKQEVKHLFGGGRWGGGCESILESA